MFEHCKWVQDQMSDYQKPWAIAGGWAIDLHAGRETREHSDIEIAIFRDDQQELKQALHTWKFKKVLKGNLEHWNGEKLQLPVHELHGSNGQEEIEVLLNEVTKNDEWIFRRDPSISFPANKLIKQSVHGLPYLHPTIVLLYKAKQMREKDHQDFLTIKDSLLDWERTWLSQALVVHQPGHVWLKQIGGSHV